MHIFSQIWSRITVNICTVLVIIITLCCSYDMIGVWETCHKIIHKLAIGYRNLDCTDHNMKKNCISKI